MDLFKDYKPEPVVARFDRDEVKATTPATRLALAVARVLNNAALGREEIAKRMSELTGENVTRVMLDNYAAQSRTHSISAVRLVALSEVTGDNRALNALLEPSGQIVVDQQYEALLKREQARDLADRFQRDAEAADAEWKAKR